MSFPVTLSEIFNDTKHRAVSLRQLKFLFHAPSPCIRRPHYGVPVGIMPYRLYETTRMLWLPDGEKSLRTCLPVSKEYGV